MIRELALLVLLAGHPDELRHVRGELDATATRIEQLKARQLAGENVRGELESLLVRAQELAGELEHALALDTPVPLREVPSSDELRERADLARDEADAVAATLGGLDLRIATLRHELRMQALRGVSDAERHRVLRHLVEQRAALVARHRALHADAGRLEAEAEAIDGETLPPARRRTPTVGGQPVRTVNTAPPSRGR
jgi:hypothetical protein